jgi:hypothetical protein
MFIQVIQGRIVREPDKLKESLDRWVRELGHGAQGWLGTTAGVTDDGTFINLVRFETAEDARRNSDRPEQGQWWAETSKLLGGEVTFRDCTETETWLRGGSDDAGFVQVMQGRVRDLEGLRAHMQRMDEAAWSAFRPEVIGGVFALDDSGVSTEAVYFTSEAEAREGERKEIPPELQPQMDDMMRCYEGDFAYFDLRDPWLYLP